MQGYLIIMTLPSYASNNLGAVKKNIAQGRLRNVLKFEVDNKQASVLLIGRSVIRQVQIDKNSVFAK